MALNGGTRLRPFTADPPSADSLASVARDAAGDLLDLVGAQLKLARVETAADLRAAVSRVARVALFVPALVVGYAFAMAALASVVAPAWGWPRALGAVAGLQIMVGGVGLYRSLQRVRGPGILSRTAAEATESLHSAFEAASVAKPRRLPDV